MLNGFAIGFAFGYIFCLWRYEIWIGVKILKGKIEDKIFDSGGRDGQDKR